MRPPICTRCLREAHGWPVARGDQCSPADWANCIREPAVVLAERAALLENVDALAKLSHARREVALARLDEAQLSDLSNWARQRADETPEGPQQRRLAKMATKLSNRAIVIVMDADRAVRIAAGEDPRLHVWSGMRGAKRGKVHSSDYQVGDTIRVPARAICGAQDRGFNGQIVGEGEHGVLATAPDGSRVVQIAMMSEGSPVFHVQRFDTGRVVEVSKPRDGRQRGNTIELYRPDAAPANPYASAS